MLNERQVTQLLKPINPARVHQDGKGFSHLEAWDVRAHMNRMFGFANWSCKVVDMGLVFEEIEKGRDGKDRWVVCYRAGCELVVNGAVYVEWAGGEAVNPRRAEAHDQAIKTAESQAFKRCAVNLGDQFGLSLYRNGSTEAVVRRTLDVPADETAVTPVVVPSNVMGFLERAATLEPAERLGALLKFRKENGDLLKADLPEAGTTVGAVIDEMLNEVLATPDGWRPSE